MVGPPRVVAILNATPVLVPEIVDACRILGDPQGKDFRQVHSRTIAGFE
jgi:hypothetical protein